MDEVEVKAIQEEPLTKVGELRSFLGLTTTVDGLYGITREGGAPDWPTKEGLKLGVVLSFPKRLQ